MFVSLEPIIKLTHAIHVLILGSILLVVACGKKAETVDNSPESYKPEVNPIQVNLEKQNVSCEENQACPSYLAKIVVVKGNKFSFCTGFLMDDDVIATSSSCLPSILRLAGQDCSKDVFFFFPKTASRPAEKVGCANVIQASDVDSDDPILWHDNISFLRLTKPMVLRRNVNITRDGLNNSKQYTAWMIDQQDENSAIVKRTLCEAVHNSYINPLAVKESSPNMLMADCKLTNAGTGAPMIDTRGRVRGVLSTSMDSRLRTYLENTGLLLEGLKDMSHATNFACAATPYDTNVLDERECLKELNYTKIDRLRSDMLSSSNLFGEFKKKLEETLGKVSNYVHFGVKFITQGDTQTTEITPQCFKPLNTWLGTLGGRSTYVEEVTLPSLSFKKVMDPYGRLKGITNESPSQDFFVQFSLKSLRSIKKSSILTWKNGEQGTITYPNISEVCAK